MFDDGLRYNSWDLATLQGLAGLNVEDLLQRTDPADLASLIHDFRTMAQDLMRHPRISPTAPPSSQLVDRLRKERAVAKTAKQIAETKFNRVEPELNELRQRVDELQTAGLQVETERNEARSDSEAYQQ